MKRIVSVLSTAVLLVLGLASCGASQVGGMESVSAEEFAVAVSEPGAQVLDVRTPDEYAHGHLENAVNVNMRDADFSRLAQSKLVKGQTVCVYCRSGNRSKTAGKILADMGYRVVELNCGIVCWEGKVVYGND